MSEPNEPNELAIRQCPTPNYQTGRDGAQPLAIVVHTTVGSFASAIAWFATSTSKVSAHYAVSLDGDVVQFVKEEDTARHAGRVRNPTSWLGDAADPNLITVGIEFEDGGDPYNVTRPAAQYRSGARLIRAVAGRWAIPIDRDHVVGHREIFDAKGCPGNLDIDRLIEEAMPAEVAVLCLMPVRNAATDVGRALQSAAVFADAVLALDDGSTDETPDLLAGAALVADVLTNPRRATYAGWDDRANRQRLLDAAAAYEPRWVVWLDADEALAADDAEALRTFLDGDAIAGCAYGLRHHWMAGDDGFHPPVSWVYRVFAHRPGATLPERRLHFEPVPDSIPRRAWVRTTIRLQHFGMASPQARARRQQKYAEADPAGHHVDGRRPAGDAVEPWTPRPAAQPVLWSP